MSRKLLKAARQERLAGKPPQQVFEQYKSQVAKETQLAYVIASVPSEERKSKYAWLNYILFALLVLAALTKALAAFSMFTMHGTGVTLVAIILGVLVPAVFAVAVLRFEGQAYPLLIILCIVNGLNVALKTELGSARWIDIGMLGVITVLAFVIKKLVFPKIGFLKVKKQANGEYAW